MRHCISAQIKNGRKKGGKGAIPERAYYININDINTRWTIFNENKFGKNTRNYTNKECTKTRESNTNRDNFYLHGGDKYGNAGGIDLAEENASFLTILLLSRLRTSMIICILKEVRNVFLGWWWGMRIWKD